MQEKLDKIIQLLEEIKNQNVFQHLISNKTTENCSCNCHTMTTGSGFCRHCATNITGD